MDVKKIKYWFFNTDAWMFTLILSLAIFFTCLEIYNLKEIVDSFVQVRADGALWLVIPCLLIAPGLLIGIPPYLVRKYRRYYS